MVYRLINRYSSKYGFPGRGLFLFMNLLRLFGISHRLYLKTIKGKFKMLLMPEDHIQRQLFWHEEYEKPVDHAIRKFLSEDSVFLDIGANIGYFSLLSATIARKGMICSFEPAPAVFQHLKKNIAENNFENIRLIQSAVGGRTGKAMIYLADEKNIGMSSLIQPENYSGIAAETDVQTIDHWIAESGLTKTDLIKIDVEGSEYDVLMGMTNTIRNFKPVIILESNPDTLKLFGKTAEDLIDFARSNELHYFLIDDSGNMKVPVSSDLGLKQTLIFIPDSKLNRVN